MSSCNDIRMSIGMPEFRNGWAKVNILGVNIHSIPLEGLIDAILLSCKDERKAIITYANIHALNLAYQIDYLCAFFNRCDVVFCDGIGVQWAAKFFQKIELYRYTPPDWFRQLARECEEPRLAAGLF